MSTLVMTKRQSNKLYIYIYIYIPNIKYKTKKKNCYVQPFLSKGRKDTRQINKKKTEKKEKKEKKIK